MDPMRYWIPALTVIALLASPPSSRAETWAEKLGYPPGVRVLILHADDAGMCHEANRATQRYLTQRLIQSASAMAPCPWFDDFAAWAAEQRELDIGLHLTVTSEWRHYRWGPVGPVAPGSGLVDGAGYLRHSVADVAGHVDAQHVALEIRAQVRRARERGLNPTHLDTHMGALYARTDYATAFLDLAEELDIPALAVEMTPPVVQHFRKQGYPLDDALLRRLEAYRLPKLDGFVAVPKGESYEQVREAFLALVGALPPGITQIVFHPALESDALARITNAWQQRVWEGQLFADPAVQAFFRDEQVVFTNWREMMLRHRQR